MELLQDMTRALLKGLKDTESSKLESFNRPTSGSAGEQGWLADPKEKSAQEWGRALLTKFLIPGSPIQ